MGHTDARVAGAPGRNDVKLVGPCSRLGKDTRSIGPSFMVARGSYTSRIRCRRGPVEVLRIGRQHVEIPVGDVRAVQFRRR